MKAAIIQTDLTWENKETNLFGITEIISGLDSETKLVILPEMFSTGFTMNARSVAETMEGPALRWMKNISSDKGFAICGSLVISDENNFFNRLLFVRPNGSVSFYDKRHLHSPSGEHEVYKSGKQRIICSYENLNFNLQVCYDLRFPVWSRNQGDSDVIIYSANWPEARIHAWKSLLIARAIENQCYVIGANRIGMSPDGTSYSGESLIIDPIGEIIGSLPSYKAGIIYSEISKGTIEKYRSHLPAWKDADHFSITD